MKEIPEQWAGTAEQWNEIKEAFENLTIAIAEAFKPIIKTFKELYSSLSDVMTDPELKRLIKKAARQQSIRDKRQQLERSRKRQQLLAENKEKSNNWRRLHGLPTRRKIKKHHKTIII